jgi:RHS repeat-associated protein
LELDENARIISYEEYYPYGSTSNQTVRKDIEVPLKRYRYTGKERDEESGLYYYGARYYTSWLGRWCSCDLKVVDNGINAYEFVHGNPLNIIDDKGMEGDWWDTTVSGVRSAQQWVKEKSIEAGEKIIDLTENFIEAAGIENKYIKGLLLLDAAIVATLVSTGLEVTTGIYMTGPNLMVGVAEAPERIGYGMSEVREGTREGGNWERALSGIGEILEATGTVASAVIFGSGGVQAVKTRIAIREATAPGTNVKIKISKATGRPGQTPAPKGKTRTPGKRYLRIEKDAATGKGIKKTTTVISREGVVVRKHGIIGQGKGGTGQNFEVVRGSTAPHYARSVVPPYQSVIEQAKHSRKVRD